MLQLRRDSRSLYLAFILPILLVILFSYAISWDVENIQTAILDQDQSSSSRSLFDAFQASGYFTLVERLDRPSEIGPLFDRGEVLIVIVVPPDFSENLGTGIAASVQVIADGSDANTAALALNYARAIVRAYSENILVAGGRLTRPLRAESRVWYNEELESKNMIVPGLVAVIMMTIAAMLTSLTIAREWERGTMEQLAATPVSRLEVILGKMLPYLAIGIIDVVSVTLLGVLIYNVPFRGNPALLLILSLAFIIGALGLGVFISAVTKSQLLATQVAMIATFLPAFLLSGFMFDIAAMPRALQVITYLIPARYFLVVTRGIFLKGVGVEVLRVQGLLMIAFAVVGLIAATRAFRKELE